MPTTVKLLSQFAASVGPCGPVPTLRVGDVRGTFGPGSARGDVSPPDHLTALWTAWRGAGGIALTPVGGELARI
jgi:hypothetical protein